MSAIRNAQRLLLIPLVAVYALSFSVNAQQDKRQAPPNPCTVNVTYYVPKPPVILSSSPPLQVRDQLEIQCRFEQITRQLEWRLCDDNARTSNSILKVAQESGSRYSGIVSINDGTVGVATSPLEGGDFENRKSWKFDEPGSYQVSCQIDNAFHFATEGEPMYLSAVASVSVSARTDGRSYRQFEPGAARRVTMTEQPSQPAPVAAAGKFRLLERQEVRRDGAAVSPAP